MEAATCRAGWTRHVFAGVPELPKDRSAKVLSLLRPEDMARLERASSLAWLPLELHMSVLGALRSALGPVGYRHYCSQRIHESLNNPLLFGRVARAGLRLYNASPWALLRVTPASVPHIFRDAGRVRVTLADDAGSATLHYDDLPPRFAQEDVWSLIWLGTVETLTAFAVEGLDLKVSVSTTLHDPAHGNFAWTAKVEGSSR